MKQTDLSTDERLRVMAIRMLHTESGQWLLTTAVRSHKSAASEIIRIGRMYQRLCHYLRNDPEGQYAAFSQVKLESNGLTLATACRLAIVEQPQKVAPTPKAPEPPAASPASVAASEATSGSKRRKVKPSGSVTSIAQARSRKP